MPTGSSLKATSLSYLINYGVDTYDLVANFDVLFMPGNSSTNGCTAHIQGRYGELVKSDELTLNGNEQGTVGGRYNRSITSKLKYYITGVISRPDTEEIRESNKRALYLHVEENYTTDYYFK